NYPVDILVAIGYTSYSDYGTKDCRMVPPVLHSKELLEPSLLNTSYPVRLVRVMSALAKLKKEQAATSAIAVSFGMGGRWYTPTHPDNLPDAPGNSSLGKPCTTSSQGGCPYGHQITSIAEELDLGPCSKTPPAKAAELRDLGCESAAPRTEDSRVGLLEPPVAEAGSAVSVGEETEVAPLGETGTTLSPVAESWCELSKVDRETLIREQREDLSIKALMESVKL
ncbi:hypothetical protein MTO96_033881, partial [Rhipicephalus appendiculatus]